MMLMFETASNRSKIDISFISITTVGDKLIHTAESIE
jgi:hypothetical protein